MKHQKAMMILFETLHLIQSCLVQVKRTSKRVSWEASKNLPVVYGLLFSLTLLSVLTTAVYNPPAAHAYYSNRPYMPMGVGELHRLSTRSLKFSGRVNLNAASLEELKTLPGVNDDVAMKIVRHRPYRQADDLYKLPTFSKGYVYQLIDRMKDRVTFE